LWLKILKKLRTASLNSKFTGSCIACLHDQNKSGFFGGPAFSSQSELFEYFLNCSDWLDKTGPPKNPLLF